MTNNKPVSCNAVMLDIETVSTHRTRAVIVSWCATAFNVRDTLHQFGGPSIGLSHHGWPSIREQLAAGRQVDMTTVMWWTRQDDRARVAWDCMQEKRIKAACEDLANFVGERELWAHGIAFDVTNVETLFEDAGVKVPWRYNNVWDERSLVRQNGQVRDVPKAIRDGLVMHRPEDDNKAAILNLWERYQPEGK